MARLKAEFLERIESFCDRIVDVAEAVKEKGHSNRIVEQIMASGTSVGANLYEADEAMSRADFTKSVCISIKELNEAKFWIRFIGRRGWVAARRLATLEAEANELRRILGTMVSRTKSPNRHVAAS